MTFQQLWLLNFKDKTRTLATSKISVLRQKWTFFIFSFTTVAKQSFFYRASLLDPYSDVMSLFCSMSRVAGWSLLKKITEHASLLYLNFLRKLEKHLIRGLFCENCGITDHSLLKVKFNTCTLLDICWRRWLQH